MNIENFSFRQIDADTEILPFDCGDHDLNGFLFDDAKRYQEAMLAVTYLLEDHTSNETVAYYCLLNDKIELNPYERSKWNKINRNIPNGKRYRSYPAVKIGRLGVSKRYAGQSIGTMILMQLKMVFSHLNRSGCRFITVDAYANAVSFYQKCGFNFISDLDVHDETRSMYFDLMYYRKLSSTQKGS